MTIFREVPSVFGPAKVLRVGALLLFLLNAGFLQAHHLEEVEEFSDGFFREETLSGNWNGLRTRLQEKGWVLELEYSGNLFHNPLGGLRRQTDYVGYLDMDLHVDLDRAVGWSHARMLIDMIHLHGTDPSRNLGATQTVSSLEAPDQFKVFLAWIEQDLWQGKASLRVGVYSLDTEFDFKNSANLFINGVFGTGLDLSETGITGPAIFPNSALGARLYLEPVDNWYVQAAVMDGVPGDPNDKKGTHLKLSGDDGVQVVAEAGYDNLMKGGRRAKAAVGSLIFTTDLPDLTDTTITGTPVNHSGTYSIYGFIDWPVTFEPGSPAQGLNLLFRVGTADPDVARFDFTLTGAAVYTGLLPGRPRDVFGIGVAGAWNGDKFRRAQAAGLEQQEWVLESSYKIPVARGMTIQPNLQYFVNPGGNPGLENAFYLGLGFHLDF